MSERARLVGINHVALEVDDLDAALEFYGSVFDFELRGRFETMAFINIGDQFIALSEGRSQEADSDHHFGLVVDDLPLTRPALESAGTEILPGRGLSFLDPFGNHVQIVAYGDVQFSKEGRIQRGMGLEHLGKSEQAIAELREAGLAD